MRFRCPGGCGKDHPLADAQLVYESATSRPARIARVAVDAYAAEQGGIRAVILCAPCTAALVLARSRA